MQSIPRSIPEAEGATVDEAGSPASPPPQTPADAPPSRGGRRPGSGRKRKAALRLMRTNIRQLTSRRLDGRTRVALAVKRWKADLTADLGGDLSRAQLTLLELAAQSMIVVSSLDSWIARQGNLVTKKRTVIPVVLQRMQIAEGLARNLDRLGLHRVEREVSLEQYLEQRAAEKAEEPKPAS